ncbi:MAG: TetR/AcrR family transcriptional regulator [Acidobacteria bacterium]|nr:TetR/AcrR family transcriptional regulator [Acidobacteriota bacterium]
MRAEKRKTEVRKEQIATAALRLVASQGMRALTLDRLAGLVGLVPSAIYRHFRGKDDILKAVLELVEARFAANVHEARKASPSVLEALRRLLRKHMGLVMEFQAIPRILFSEDVYSGNPERKDQLHRLVSGLLDALRAIFEEGQARGEIRADLPAGSLAVMFLGLFQPSMFLWHLSGGEFDVVRQTEQSWRVFTAALEPPGGEAGNDKRQMI